MSLELVYYLVRSRGIMNRHVSFMAPRTFRTPPAPRPEARCGKEWHFFSVSLKPIGLNNVPWESELASFIVRCMTVVCVAAC